MWIGTEDGLDLKLAPAAGGAAGFKSYRHDPGDPESLSHDYVSSLCEDGSGALWIGTRHGLNRFRKETETFRRFHHDPSDGGSLSSDSIQALLEDRIREGTLWIGTEDSGLNRLDVAAGRFRRYLTADGLPSNVISAIEEDDDGNLWLSTSVGLSKFQPDTEAFRNYDSSDGLESHGFTRNAGLRSTRGEIFFGGNAGLTSFVPAQVRDNPHPPPMAVTSFKVFNQELERQGLPAEMEQVELGHRDNFISIEVAALDYTAPRNNEYAFRLEGVDRDWVHAGNRNYVSYANLSPGDYVFRFKGSNSDGVWNRDGGALRISVRPPFWQTWWFRASSLLALAATVVAIIRIRTGAIRARNRELEKINQALNEQIRERRRAQAEREKLIQELEARNTEMERFTYTVSHDLKSPLITMKGFLGYWLKDAAAGNVERMKKDIRTIGSAADKMHRLLEELLELSRIGRVVNPPVEISLSELAREAVAQVAGSIAERGVAVAVAPDLRVVFGDRVRLLEVLQNLVENAVKFIGDQAAPRIEIASRQEAGETVLLVRDNGMGIDASYRERIFELFERLDSGTEGTGIGLALVKRIVEVHGGRIWVESEGKGHGSTFCLTLPLPSALDHPSATRAAI